MEMGADAVMVTPTKEAAPTPDDMLLNMYAHIAEVCPGLPIVLQDHPASTQVHMSMPLVARIAREVPTVACIKLESLPSPAKIAQLRKIWAAEPLASECTILTGLGALYGGFDLEQGTEGVRRLPPATIASTTISLYHHSHYHQPPAALPATHALPTLFDQPWRP